MQLNSYDLIICSPHGLSWTGSTNCDLADSPYSRTLWLSGLSIASLVSASQLHALPSQVAPAGFLTLTHIAWLWIFNLKSVWKPINFCILHPCKTSISWMTTRSAASLSRSLAPLDHNCNSLWVLRWQDMEKFFCRRVYGGKKSGPLF
jgi:hypothetical protein